jgi:hypothetical protein
MNKLNIFKGRRQILLTGGSTKRIGNPDQPLKMPTVNENKYSSAAFKVGSELN